MSPPSPLTVHGPYMIRVQTLLSCLNSKHCPTPWTQPALNMSSTELQSPHFVPFAEVAACLSCTCVTVWAEDLSVLGFHTGLGMRIHVRAYVSRFLCMHVVK